MRTFYLTFLLCLASGLFLEASAQVYVDHAATGMNNGTSWEDAYTNLQNALANANPGDEIRAAQGTYLPGTTPAATFLIDKNLHLLGGYDASTGARDPEMYVTTLSGDLNGDDAEDDLTNFRSDNARTVVRIEAGITNATLIDGFTIRGGHAGGSGAANESGGGVYALGAPVIRNCNFEQNYALMSGGGLYLGGSGSEGALIENCLFEKNRADKPFDAGGGLYVGNVEGNGVSVSECRFIENEGGRGGGLACIDANLQVANSTFMGNVNERQGGGLWCWQNTSNLSLEVDGCTFEGNQSSFGGGLYFVSSAGVQNDSLIVSNSIFVDNTVVPNSIGWDQAGGAINTGIGEGSFNNTILIDNCGFYNNSSTQSGGGISSGMQGDLNNYQITNSVFSGNTAAYNGSGFSVFLGGLNNQLDMQSCAFSENEAQLSGGGAFVLANEIAGQSNVMINGCTFSQNTSSDGSGLLVQSRGQNIEIEVKNSQFLQNTAMDYAASAAADFYGTGGGTGTFTVDSCHFEGNYSYWSGGVEMGTGYNGGGDFDFYLSNSTFLGNSSTEGGAIGIWTDDGGMANFHIENCWLDGNTSTLKAGGIAIYPNTPNFHAAISRTEITNNQSPEGGAIYIFESPNPIPFSEGPSCNIENSLITGNTSNNAAISVDSIRNFQLINCTIADNSGGGIGIAGQSSLTLQNTILYNPGFAEFVGTSDVAVTSNGGNLIGDGSLAAHAHSSYDQQNTDPLFAGMDDFHLTENSPAVDAGVDAGNLSDTDLEGNGRVINCVDIGAYESEFTVAMECLTGSREVVAGEVKLSPNPATDFLNIQLPENISQAVEFTLFDTQGRLVYQEVASPGHEAIKVEGLARGLYIVKGRVGNEVYVGKFVKE